MSDTISKMADELFESVKGLLLKRIGPIEGRVRALEERKPEKGEKGQDADAAAIADQVLEKVMKALEAIPAAKDGKNADPEFVRSTVRDEVSRAVSALPPAERGKDAPPIDMVALSGQIMAAAAAAVAVLPVPSNGRDFDPALLKSEVERVFATIPKPENGRDADPELVEMTVAALLPGLAEKSDADLTERVNERLATIRRDLLEEIAIQVKALPPAEKGKDANPAEIAADVLERVMRSIRAPLDGKSVTLEEVRPVIDAEIDRRMALIRAPLDGKSVTVDDVRPLLEGEVSRWALDFERRAADLLQRAVDGIPRPKDGLGFDDLDMEEKDDRTIVWVFGQGERQKRFEYTLPMLIDRGTYKAGEAYQRGDALTYGGSLFIAQRDTLPTEKPEDGTGAFRLAVKRGRDGGGS